METKSIILLSLVILLLSLDTILGKYILNQGAAPIPLSVVRTGIATIFLFTFIFLTKHKKYLHFDRKHIVDLAIIGISVSGIASVIGMIGLSLTTATNLSFLRLTPFVVAFLSYIILKERLPRMFWILLITVSIGILLLSTGGKIEPLNKGDTLVLFSTFFHGFGLVWAKKTMKNVKPMIVAVGRFFFGNLILILFLFLFGISQITTLSNMLLLVFISGLLDAAWVTLTYIVIEKEGPSVSITFTRASPLLVAILAFFFLGERLSTIQIVGALIIFLSVLGVSRIKAKYVNN